MVDGIIRVFAKRTQYTPDDDYVFIGLPKKDQSVPLHDAVHVSCVFTWDRAYCEWLQNEWKKRTSAPVLLGGPAYDSSASGFDQGMYIKNNIIFTSRGCNNHCSHCNVWRNEGPLKELPISIGNIIQDNNFLQCSISHKDKVFDMLQDQRKICFKGGLQVGLIDEHFLERAAAIKRHIAELWIACDSDSAIPSMQKAVDRLYKAGFNQNKIYCYALIGDDMDKNEARCRAIYEAGAMPRAQLYREFDPTKTQYHKAWEAFERMWQRPCATVSHVKHGTNFWDFGI